MNNNEQDERRADEGREIIALWRLFIFDEEAARLQPQRFGLDAWAPADIDDRQVRQRNVRINRACSSFWRFAGCVEELPGRVRE